MRAWPRSTPRWSAPPPPARVLRWAEMVAASARLASASIRTPEPLELRADPLAQCRAVLADTGGEGQHVEPAEHGGECADLAHDAPHVQVQCRARPRIDRFRLQQVLGAGGRTGNAEQAGLVIQQIGELLDAQLFRSIRCSSTPGSSAPQRVPIIRPSRAEKPIVVATLRRCSIAQRLAPLPRCATIVRPCACIAMTLGQGDRHVFVRQPVKAVAPDTALPQRMRQGQHLLHRRQRAVKGGVEARHLRQVRRSFEQHVDRLQRDRVDAAGPAERNF